jgi:hypothetical protein
MWTTYATHLSPAAVATLFAVGSFDPPREVAECWGAWTRRTYRGVFTLKGGTRTYRLIGDADGQWAVTPEADGPGTEGGQG